MFHPEKKAADLGITLMPEASRPRFLRCWPIGGTGSERCSLDVCAQDEAYAEMSKRLLAVSWRPGAFGRRTGPRLSCPLGSSSSRSAPSDLRGNHRRCTGLDDAGRALPHLWVSIAAQGRGHVVCPVQHGAHALRPHASPTQICLSLSRQSRVRLECQEVKADGESQAPAPAPSPAPPSFSKPSSPHSFAPKGSPELAAASLFTQQVSLFAEAPETVADSGAGETASEFVGVHATAHSVALGVGQNRLCMTLTRSVPSCHGCY